MKIYERKVFVHHYTEYMDVGGFDQALQNCTDVIENYSEMERLNHEAKETAQQTTEDQYKYRFRPII